MRELFTFFDHYLGEHSVCKNEQNMVLEDFFFGEPVMDIDRDWPSKDAFIDITKGQEFSDGAVRCTAVAVCNRDGAPCRIFYQGETVHFFYEFMVLSEIGVPAGGLQMEDVEGRVIYGKNSFQCDGTFPAKGLAGSLLRYRHTVDLELAPGKYTFSFGCVSTDAVSLHGYQRGVLSHLEFSQRITEHCRIALAGSFVVRFQRKGALSHYGVANLPGAISLVAVNEGGAHSMTPQGRFTPEVVSPTVFHITHWKAGSQWILKILEELFPDLLIKPQLHNVQFLHWAIQRGKIYPTLFVNRHQFESVRLPDNCRKFVIIRDLRDTLVSAYFSFKFSHPVLDYGTARTRTTLEALKMEDALVYLMDEFLPACVRIQLSWLECGEQLFRYEDFLKNDLKILSEILIERCLLPIDHKDLEKVVFANRFESLTKGRSPGEEDPKSHQRKGISGDWKNHFTPGVKRAFKARYGGVLIATGYEEDMNW